MHSVIHASPAAIALVVPWQPWYHHHMPTSYTSSSSSAYRLFPGTDCPHQPLHDVRLTPATVASLGCGAFGHVRLRLIDSDTFLFPARVVPCRSVLEDGHVLMAEAAMAALGAKMGSTIKPVLRRAFLAIGAGASVGSLLMLRFLSMPVAYRIVAMVDRQEDEEEGEGGQVEDMVLVSAAAEHEVVQAADGEGTTTPFAATVLEEILEVVEQAQTARRGSESILVMQGMLLSGMHGAGKTFFLQQVRRRLGMDAVVYVQGRDLLQLLVDGDDARVQQLLLSGNNHRRTASVLLLDDFDHLLLGGDEEEGATNVQEEEPGSRAATHALKALQRFLKGPRNHRPVCWILATRLSVKGAGRVSSDGGRASLHRLTSLQGSLYDKVLELPVPSMQERVSILRHVLQKQQQAQMEDILLEQVGNMTGGFLPGDLVTLCQVAAFKALAAAAGKAREGDVMPWMEAFVAARKEVSPAALRGVGDRQHYASTSSLSVYKLSWNSIGGYEDVKSRLQKLVEWPVRYAETFARLGLRQIDNASHSHSSLPGGGILLHGPSGCGKSLFARVLAEEVGANFVELPASEVFSPFLGDSEARVRRAFAQARQAAPCILFLDELDTMAAGRDEASDGSNTGGVYARVLSTLLNEMDGVSGQAQGLLVLAATNRREAVDAALLRPGRLQEALFIRHPHPEVDYLPILQVATRHMSLGPDVDLSSLVSKVLAPLTTAPSAPPITPADLLAVCREAGLACLRELGGKQGEEEDDDDDGSSLVVCQAHFVRAVETSLKNKV